MRNPEQKKKLEKRKRDGKRKGREEPEGDEEALEEEPVGTKRETLTRQSGSDSHRQDRELQGATLTITTLQDVALSPM